MPKLAACFANYRTKFELDGFQIRLDPCPAFVFECREQLISAEIIVRLNVSQRST
jgi:hypothetical protein